MIEIIQVNLESFSFDKTGQWCILKFFPYEDRTNNKNISYYSIVPTDQIHAFGGIPSVCILLPLTKAISESELFTIDKKFQPASFEGVPYAGRNSEKQPFWLFESPRTIQQFMRDIKKFIPDQANQIIGQMLEQMNRQRIK